MTLNIFFLSTCPNEAARFQCDKHVVKMVLETAQLMSTAHHVHGSRLAHRVYKPTHRNHPSGIWTRMSSANYDWLGAHLCGLLAEYTYRYRKTHATAKLLPLLASNPCDRGPLTVPLLALPDDLRPTPVTWDSAVEAYRAYYRRDKQAMLTYTRRGRPAWLLEE